MLADDVLDTISQESARIDERLEAQREALENCLGRLSAGHRSLVLRAYVPGVQIKDLAAQGGRTVRTISGCIAYESG